MSKLRKAVKKWAESYTTDNPQYVWKEHMAEIDNVYEEAYFAGRIRAAREILEILNED